MNFKNGNGWDLNDYKFCSSKTLKIVYTYTVIISMNYSFIFAFGGNTCEEAWINRIFLYVDLCSSHDLIWEVLRSMKCCDKV